MKEKNKIASSDLIYSLLFFAFGIILLTSTESLISLVSKVIGVAIILVGIINSITYVYMKGKLGKYNISKLIIGILIICFGLLLIFYSNTLSFTIRFLTGMWILFSSINRIILAISIKSVDKLGFKVYIATSMFMLLLAIILISGIFDKIIGLFIIGYSIAEIVNYIYYTSKNKTTIQKNNKKINKKIEKLKNNKVIDAVIDE